MIYIDDRGRDLPDRSQILNLQEKATSFIQQSLPAPVEGLWVSIHDDRERSISGYQRTLGSGAAALAQRYLKIADELMRMAGNAQHNSPNGFDKVARDILTKSLRDAHSAEGNIIALQETLNRFVDRGGWNE